MNKSLLLTVLLPAACLLLPAHAESPGAIGGPNTRGCQKVEDGYWCAVKGCLTITRVMYMSEDNIKGPGFANTRLDIKNSCNGAVDFAIRGKLNNEPVTIEPGLVEAKQTLRHPVPLTRPTNTNRVTATLNLIPYGNARDYNHEVADDIQTSVATRRITVTLEPIRSTAN